VAVLAPAVAEILRVVEVVTVFVLIKKLAIVEPWNAFSRFALPAKE